MIKIYIIATNTGTVMSRIIQFASSVPYPHVSISLEDNLDKMYSLGRKYTRTAFPAGFIEENRFKGIFAHKQNTKCIVYSLYIEKEQYSKLSYNIEHCIKNKKHIKYDTLSLISLLHKKNKIKENKFVCSTFVAWALENSDIKIFDKDYFLITPLDFYKCKELKVEYEGLLCEYNIINNSHIDKKQI